MTGRNRNATVAPSGAGARAVPPTGPARASAPGAPAVVALFAHDATLVATLRDAAPDVAFAVVASAQELADVLVARACTTLFVELAALGGGATTLLPHLARQFPDLPIVAVGTRTDEAPVARLVSGGEVYRFLHVPVSHDRARTFIGAALRRAEELRRMRPAAPPLATATALAAHSASAGHPPDAPNPATARAARRAPPPRRGSTAPARLFVAAGLALALAAGWAWWSRPSAPPPVPPDAPVADLVGAARDAAAEGALVSPSGRSAADYYRAALARRPNDPEARAGVVAIAARLLEAGEQALAEGRLDAAEAAAATVALVRPQDPRARALGSGVARAQAERARLVADARTAAPSTTPRSPPPVAKLQAPAPGAGTESTARTESAARPVDDPPPVLDAPAAAAAPPLEDAPRVADTPTASDAPAVTAVTPAATAASPPDPTAASAATAPAASEGRTAIVVPGSSEAPSLPPPASSAIPPPPASPAANPFAKPRAPLRKLVDAAPVYPRAARSRNVEGWVDVAFTVEPDGRTARVRVLSSQPAGTFDEAALAAVREWRYAPLPAPQDANVRLRFRVDR